MKTNKIMGAYEVPEVKIVLLKAEGILCGSTDYKEGGSFGDNDGPNRVIGAM